MEAYLDHVIKKIDTKSVNFISLFNTLTHPRFDKLAPGTLRRTGFT